MPAQDSVDVSSSFNYWSRRWSTDDAPWTRDGIHDLLRDNADAVLDGKRSGTVFLPMCGAAAELKWFYERGFRVVGVEFVESVAGRFFSTHGLPVVEGRCPVTGCKILATPDLKLSIYICDLYSFSRECAGPMDIVWDRGGLVSIAEQDRRRYIILMKSLLARDFSYALYATEYDDVDFAGFPRNVSLSLIRQLYGEDFLITRLGVTFIERSYVKNKLIKETLWHLKKGTTLTKGSTCS